MVVLWGIVPQSEDKMGIIRCNVQVLGCEPCISTLTGIGLIHGWDEVTSCDVYNKDHF